MMPPGHMNPAFQILAKQTNKQASAQPKAQGSQVAVVILALNHLVLLKVVPLLTIASGCTAQGAKSQANSHLGDVNQPKARNKNSENMRFEST